MRAEVFIVATLIVAFVVANEYIVPGDFPIKIDNIPQVEPGIKIVDKTKVRIIGGKQARKMQFPYQAGLVLNLVPDKIQSWCGGSLISTRHVLTAAHCVFFPEYSMLANGSIEVYYNNYEILPSIDVYLGITENINLNLYAPEKQHMQVTRDNIIMHEAFDMNYLRNDIAVLNLPTTVQLNQYVQLINLPRRSQTNLLGKSIVSSGWGIYIGQKSSNHLLYAKFNVISYSQCTPYFNYTIVDNYHICINAQGRSACQGDSGGPSVITDAYGSKTVVGVLSFVSPLGCYLGYPTVLTRVTSYLDWIQQNTGIQIKY